MIYIYEQIYHLFLRKRQTIASTQFKIYSFNFFSDKEDIEVFNEDKTISSKRVRKTGRTTGLTFGLLSNKMESICFEKPPGSGNRLPFYNLYVVKKIAEEDPLFFKPGDSGSGVFVVEDGKPDKALGIGIAIAIFSQETYVCKIANILNTLGLKLVRYRENNQEQTLQRTNEEKNEEKM